MRFVGAAAVLLALSACTQGSKQQAPAAAPTDLPSERVQLKLGQVDTYSNIVVDVQFSPEGMADKFAGPMASLATSILKFCRPSDGPFQGIFTLDHSVKSEIGTTASQAVARCYQRNLEEFKFPEVPNAVHVRFQVSGDGPLAAK